MSGGGLVEVLAAALRGQGLTDEPETYDGDIHSWRCSHPDIYGRCDCFAETVRDLADVVTAHLAARLEGCREEVWRAVVNNVESPLPLRESEAATDAALAVVREALNVAPETQGAALSASDSADGPESHREATRAGDEL